MRKKVSTSESSHKPTLRDVAREMDLSVTTISKVINDHDDISDETKRKVWSTINRINYTPNFMASNLRRKHGNLVGLILSDISQPFFSEIISGYEMELNAAGYQTLIFTSYEDSARELRLLQQVTTLNVAGLIVDIAQNSEKSIQLLRSLDIPFVLSNRYVNREQDNFVVADNVTAGYEAVRHILGRKPGYPVLCVNGPDVISPTTDRFDGYIKALEEAGISYTNEWVFDNHYSVKDAWVTGIEICQKFKPPFSVFCSTDMIAIGVMRAVMESGYSVPEDVSIIGVDDIAFSSYITPTLTTMSLPKKIMGQKSAQKLITLIEHGKVKNPREFIQPILKVREST